MWESSGSANIAFIKYMGKKENNIPTNPSLSFTLDKYQTNVKLEKSDHFQDEIISSNVNLDDFDKIRFVNHLRRVKEFLHFNGSFKITTSNNFPSHCGFSSSSSSFCALTKVASLAISDLTNQAEPNVLDLANLSRLGSGSSCRSFYSPWTLWKESSIEKIDLPFENLIHDVILVDSNKKKISSTHAHKKVFTSLLFSNRDLRAKSRLDDLIKYLRNNDWKNSYLTMWAEFQDMHALFHTSIPSFSYFNPKVTNALNILEKFWEDFDDGPLVTMDAGPNIHLFYRTDQVELQKEIKEKYLLNLHANE